MSICRKLSRWRAARREKKKSRIAAEARLYMRMVHDGFPPDPFEIPNWMIWTCFNRLEKDPNDALAHHTLDMLETFEFGRVVTGPSARRP